MGVVNAHDQVCTGCDSPADRFCYVTVRKHPFLGRLSLRHLCAQPICNQCVHRGKVHIPGEMLPENIDTPEVVWGHYDPSIGQYIARVVCDECGAWDSIRVMGSTEVSWECSPCRARNVIYVEAEVGSNPATEPTPVVPKPSRKELARQRSELVELLRDLEEPSPSGDPSPTAVSESVSSSSRRAPRRRRRNRNG